MTQTRSTPATQLLEHRDQLTLDARKTLRRFSVQVPPGTRTLYLLLDYTPRRPDEPSRCAELVRDALERQHAAARDDGVTLDPERVARQLAPTALQRQGAGLRNLLNLVLRDAQGTHRGRWDRNLPHDDTSQELVLAEEWASEGLVAGPLPAGPWELVLEVHEVLVPCQLQLRLRACPEAPADEHVPRTSGGAPPSAAREFTTQLPTGWLRGELHCHSTASDGHYAPTELVQRAQHLGLDFIALTDHNSTAGLAELDQAPLPVLRGCELTTFGGHFLALGLPRGAPAPAWYEHERPLPPAEMSRVVRDQGALFGLAHPYVLGNPLCCGCRLEWEVPQGGIDLVEVWSRGAEDPLAHAQALRLLDRLRAGGQRVVAVAGRDWHGPSHEQQHSGRRFPATVVRAEPRAEAILAALARGACYLSVGPRLDFSLSSGEHSAGLGQELALARDSQQPVTARVALAELDQPAQLTLMAAGRCIHVAELQPGDQQLELPGLQPVRGGMRLELRDQQQRPLVISNPIECFTPARPAARR